MKKKFGNGNGSGMDRDCIGNGSVKSRKLFALLFCLLFVGVGNAWGTSPQIDLRGKSSALVIPKADSESSYAGWDWKGIGAPGSDGSATITITQSAVTYGTIDVVHVADTKATTSSGYPLLFTKTSGSLTTTILSDYGVDIVINCKSKNADEMTIDLTGADQVKAATSWTTKSISTTNTSATLTIASISTASGACGLEYIKITPKAAVVSSIALKTSATKTAYVAGEDFAPAGLVITATYSDKSTADIDYDTHSSDFSFSPSTNLTAGTTSTTVTYATKTCSQSINVYSVTLQVQDEDGNAIGVGGPGLPTRTGASISPAADAANYAWKKWLKVNASLSGADSNKNNTITNPTDAVTITAVYNKPRTVTWMVNGAEYTPYTTTGKGTDGTAVVKHGTSWSSLTLPTDPDPKDYCGAKFMGWTTTNIGATGLDKTDDADDIAALVLMTSANKASMTGAGKNINSNITFYAVFADYAE